MKEYLPNETLHQNFIVHEGRGITMPEKFMPDPELLRYHREKRFRG